MLGLGTDLSALNERMLRSSDEELLKVVTTDRAQYRQVAIDLASKELMRRNLPLPLINNPQTECPEQLEPEDESSPLEWLLWTVVVGFLLVVLNKVLDALVFIIDNEITDPLWHKHPSLNIINKVFYWLTIPWVGYRFYNWYKWYKNLPSEDVVQKLDTGSGSNRSTKKVGSQF
jgi:hypothetical protein